MRNQCIAILKANDDVSRNGSQIDANQIVSASFQVLITAGDTGAAGTVKIQASNDPIPSGSRPQFVATDWSDIPNASVTVTAGVPSSGIILIPNMAFSFIRAVFVQSSAGTGVVTVNMNSLGI